MRALSMPEALYDSAANWLEVIATGITDQLPRGSGSAFGLMFCKDYEELLTNGSMQLYQYTRI